MKKFFTTYLPITIACILAVVFVAMLFYGFSDQKKADAAWYSSGGTWGYRKMIVIDRTKVATTTSFTNFPMLFSVVDPDLKLVANGGKVASSTGKDILFTSSDGTTKLDHEIERYSSTTGETIMWVEIPTLSATVDTVIYVYFGNASASDQTNTTGTWNSNYKVVLHLPNGTTISGTDSTSNGNNGTNTSGTAAVGKMGGGVDFPGTAPQKIEINSSLWTLAGSTYTVSMWVKAVSFSETVLFDAANGTGVDYLQIGSPIGVNVSFGGSYRTYNNTRVSAGVWNYITVTQNGDLYVNGVLQAATGGFVNDPSNSGVMYIGKLDFSPTYSLWGSIDEFRVSNVVRSAGWIRTEYNNQSDPSSFYAYGGTDVQTRNVAGVKLNQSVSGAASWYNSSWLYRKKITVDKTKVATTTSLTSFPMLVSVTDPDLKIIASGGKVGNSGATDIVFTSSDGTTKIDHEIEKYDSSTGQTVAWVEIPTLSGTADTIVYMYFGNAGASDQQNISGTWDSNFKGVWHLNDLTESTSASLDLTANNASTITGKIGGAYDYTGGASDSCTSVNAVPTTAVDNITYEAWMKPDTVPAINIVLATGNEPNGIGFGVGNGIGASGSEIQAGYFGVGWANTDVLLKGASQWDHVVFTRESGLEKFYLNGSDTGWGGTSNTPNASANYLTIGCFRNGANVIYEYDGIIDEVRVSNTVRSSGWILTTYRNQNNPSEFYSYGGLETKSGIQTSSGSTAPNVKSRGGVKLR